MLLQMLYALTNPAICLTGPYSKYDIQLKENDP